MNNMDFTEGDIANKLIVNKLFKFIEKHFNDFDHQKRSGNDTWFTPSWSPFIQTCFIKWGKELKMKVGGSYTKSNLEKFWEKIYGSDYEKPNDRGFDVSWHDDEYEFILGLEHEETGKKSEVRLEEIYDELEKLRNYKGHNKILTSRPYFNTKQNYREVENNYKEKIEQKLKQIKPGDKENWIIILIGLKNQLKPSQNKTEILFCCYFWEVNRLSRFNMENTIPIRNTIPIIMRPNGKVELYNI